MSTKRIVGWSVLAFFAGLLITYFIVVAGLFWHAQVNKIVDRDGGMSMGIIFIIGPVCAIIGGVIAAALTAIVLMRRRRMALPADQAANPARPWPSSVRAALIAVPVGLVVYYLGWVLVWLFSEMRFDNYWTAFAITKIPAVTGLAAAALTAYLALRNARRAPGQPDRIA